MLFSFLNSRFQKKNVVRVLKFSFPKKNVVRVLMFSSPEKNYYHSRKQKCKPMHRLAVVDESGVVFFFLSPSAENARLFLSVG